MISGILWACTSSTPPAKEEPLTISLAVEPAMLPADGVATAVVRAITTPGREVSVRLTTDRGRFVSSDGREMTATSTGTLEAPLISCLAARPDCLGTATIEATAGDARASATLELVTPSSGSSSSSGGASSSGGTNHPAITNVVVSPQLAGVGTEVSVGFQVNPAPTADPVVTVAGQAATRHLLSGTTWQYRYSVLGSEMEGVAPVHITALLPDGTQATAQASVTLDFSAPPPPEIILTPDGNGAFVGPGVTVEATFPSESGVARCELCVARDGTCDNEWSNATFVGGTCNGAWPSCTDGETLTINIRGRDNSGNPWIYGNAITRICDATPPQVGSVGVLGRQIGMVVGGPFTFSATAEDPNGAGVGRCQVCHSTDNVCDTEWTDGTFADGRCGSSTTTCQAGTQTLQVRVDDRVGQRGTSAVLRVTCDNGLMAIGPLVVTNNGHAQYVPGRFTMSMAVADSGAGITGCEQCLSTDGTCDTEWTAAMVMDGTCTSTELTCEEGTPVTLNLRATDPLATEPLTGTAQTFTCDATPPSAPTGFTVTDNGTLGQLRFSWQPSSVGSGAPLSASPYTFSYALDTAPPYNGTGATEGPSPLRNLISPQQQLSGLPNCRLFHLAVTAQDVVGQLSEPATLTARTRCGSDGTFTNLNVLERSYPTLDPRKLIHGDFNADGIADLAVLSDYQTQMWVQLGTGSNGRGDRHFSAPVAYSLTDRPSDIATGDFNADGIADLVVGYSRPYVGVLLGNGSGGRGDGTFGQETTFNATTSYAAERLAVGDYNRDGIQDVLALDAFYDRLHVMTGQGANGRGDGTFNVTQVSLSPAVFSLAPALLVVDVTADGVLDVLVVDAGNDRLQVFRGDGSGAVGSGTFTHHFMLQLSTAETVVDAEAWDADGDGITDVILAVHTSQAGIRVLKGQSASGRATGEFSLGSSYFEPQNPRDATDLIPGDFNGDGVRDAVVLASDFYGPSNVVLFQANTMAGRPLGSFTARSTLPHPTFFDAVGTAVDVNGDRTLDLALLYDNINQGLLLVNVATGAYQHGTGALGPASHTDVGAGPQTVLSADLNGDHVPDAVVLNSAAGNVGVLLGSGLDAVGNRAFGPMVTYDVGGTPVAAALGDLNNDGVLDLVTANDSEMDVSVLLGVADAGAPTGTFAAAVPTGTGGRGAGVVLADFNGDLVLDAAVTNRAGANVKVLLGGGTAGRGDGTLGTPTDHACAPQPAGIAVGDFNRDAILDLVVANEAGGLSVLLGSGRSGRGDGGFTGAVASGGTAPARSVVAADLNDDAILDLVVTRGSGGSVDVLLGQGSNGRGNGTFADPQPIATGMQPHAVAVADLNNDAILDLVFTDAGAGTVGVALGAGSGGRGTGTFGTATSTMAASMPVGLALVDADGSGTLEALVVSSDTNMLVQLQGM